MRRCNKLERYYESGRFGESLNELPDALKKHLVACQACREKHKEIIEIERTLLQLDPDVPGSVARARIRMGVLKTIDTQEKHIGFSIFQPLLNPRFLSAAAMIIATLLLYGVYQSDRMVTPHSPLKSPETILTQIDQNTFSEMEHYNDQLINQDFGTLADSSLLAYTTASMDDEITVYANELLLDDSDDVYSEDILQVVTEFDETDWDDLRRYLS